MESTKNLNMEYNKRLSQLENEHSTLRFETFNSDIAIAIGLKLLERAKEEKLSITIDICMGKQQLFHCALEGTDEENDRWVIRKNRVALKFQKSSYYISLLLKSNHTTIEAYYHLDSVDYAPYGGAYPIMDMEGKVLGTITVSGLPDHEDHRVVTETIKWFLKKRSFASL
ncbi:MAG: hypothetical protein CVU98_11090 [Firmicutes bacterium HGW-Firmicutes-3]|nr:MAG: hypothetical protein CVU98_11090 [Firmicutes bacterium HGW-Firmicutes-3]